MQSITIKNIKRFRKNIKIRKPQIGAWMQISDSNIAEIMSSSNYDWVAADMEHGVFSIDKLPDIFRAIELNNKLPLVRLPNKKKEISAQALDAGSGGVIIPNINSAIELENIKQACYFPSKGRRGVGFSRSNLFGKRFKIFKTRPIIIAMIENAVGVNNLEEILSVDGLDAILIGPYDLSSSMGMTGKFDNAKFKKTINHIKVLAKKKKIACGIHVMEPKNKNLKSFIKSGFLFLPYATDALLLNDSISRSFTK
jgi:2-dehydro-3-deoxyglucarate aldolase